MTSGSVAWFGPMGAAAAEGKTGGARDAGSSGTVGASETWAAVVAGGGARIENVRSGGNAASTFDKRSSRLDGASLSSSTDRFFGARRWTPGRLPPPLPRLGGTVMGSPVASIVIMTPSLFFRRFLESERA